MNLLMKELFMEILGEKISLIVFIKVVLAILISPAVLADRLESGQYMAKTYAIPDATGSYKFIFQSDGNLVLYKMDRNIALWSSNTGGTNAQTVVLQKDGNLVILDDGAKIIWQTKTYNNVGAYLIVQADGNVVIYNREGTRPLWSTGTNQQKPRTIF